MAFLDNSGDIILDAVLTDTGRMRLAKGDGSFRIVKFALGDDEIDYSLFNKDHASGSAYFDLAVMQTPVLEAFTNNASSMKNKLISFSRTDLLYLPVIRINEIADANKTVQSAAAVDGTGMFFVTVDSTTSTTIQRSGSPFNTSKIGVLFGAEGDTSSTIIRLDQGIDNVSTSPTVFAPSDLIETSYIIQIDNRFGYINDTANGRLPPSFIDDDNIATYYVSQGSSPAGTQVVKELTRLESSQTADAGEIDSPIKGSRGTKIEFKIKASADLETSSFLFTQLGGGSTITINSQLYYYIDSNIRITGATTGYSVNAPVRFLKHKGAA
jgi:hypothetical protein